MIVKASNNKRNLDGNKRVLFYIKRFFKGIIILIIALLAIGIIYENVGSHLDNKKYKPVGEVFEVNGHDMHIFTKGSGSETVVFASGWGISSPYVDLYPLYNEISEHTKVAVYDRPGYGWSEACDTPRDIDTITKEIHELLEKSGAKAPYILVGHSLGSLEIVRFAQMYKDEVKGIVTIDGGNPEFYANSKSGENKGFNTLIKVCKNFGIARFLINNTAYYDSLIAIRNDLSFVPENMMKIDKAMTLKNVINKNVSSEINNLNTNALTVIENGKLKDIPLRVISAEKNVKGIDKWLKSQRDFLEWSTDSEQIVIKDSHHYIHHYTPDKIVKEILEIVDNRR